MRTKASRAQRVCTQHTANTSNDAIQRPEFLTGVALFISLTVLGPRILGVLVVFDFKSNEQKLRVPEARVVKSPWGRDQLRSVEVGEVVWILHVRRSSWRAVEQKIAFKRQGVAILLRAEQRGW